MKLEEIKQINHAANTLTFALCKILNNYADVIKETPANGWISIFDIIENLIRFDHTKGLFTTAKDFNGKVFEIIERQREFNALFDDMENESKTDNDTPTFRQLQNRMMAINVRDGLRHKEN